MRNGSRMTYSEMERIMFQYNSDHPERMEHADLRAVIVFSPDNWTEPYTEEQRSYEVCNNNRGFQPGKIANSVYGYCIDGSDPGVRLDWYKWKPEYCYFPGYSKIEEGVVE